MPDTPPTRGFVFTEQQLIRVDAGDVVVEGGDLARVARPLAGEDGEVRFEFPVEIEVVHVASEIDVEALADQVADRMTRRLEGGLV